MSTTPIPTPEALALASSLLPALEISDEYFVQEAARRIDAFAKERAAKLPAVPPIRDAIDRARNGARMNAALDGTPTPAASSTE